MTKLLQQKENKGGLGSVAIGVVIFFAIVIGIGFLSGEDSGSNLEPTTRKVFTFNLTHGMGKKLVQNATFTCGDIPTWTINMNNGEKLEYQILSGGESLCGIKARDNLGSNCEICVISTEKEKMTLRLRYSDDITMVFDGYLTK